MSVQQMTFLVETESSPNFAAPHIACPSCNEGLDVLGVTPKSAAVVQWHLGCLSCRSIWTLLAS